MEKRCWKFAKETLTTKKRSLWVEVQTLGSPKKNQLTINHKKKWTIKTTIRTKEGKDFTLMLKQKMNTNENPIPLPLPVAAETEM